MNKLDLNYMRRKVKIFSFGALLCMTLSFTSCDVFYTTCECMITINGHLAYDKLYTRTTTADNCDEFEERYIENNGTVTEYTCIKK